MTMPTQLDAFFDENGKKKTELGKTKTTLMEDFEVSKINKRTTEKSSNGN